jgi:hypothetical protein
MGMSKFSVQKVVFTGGLLTIIAALYPLIAKIGDWGFVFINYHLTIIDVYYVLVILLFISIFSYALNYITSKPLSFFSSVGNFSYAVSILTPVIYIFLYLIQILFLISNGLINAIGVNRNLVSIITSGIAGIASLIFVSTTISRLYSSVGKNDILSTLDYLEDQKIEELEKAKLLLEQQSYRSSFFWLIEGIKKSLARILLLKNISITGENLEDMIQPVFDFGGLSPDALKYLISLSSKEKQIRWSGHEIDQKELGEYIKKAYPVIASIDQTTEKDRHYYFEKDSRYSRLNALMLAVILAFGILLFHLYNVLLK